MTSFQRLLRLCSGAAAGFSLAAGAARAEEPREAGTEPPVLVELFLSQACSMCPPAAALFPEIAARDDVVALSWHIDYWNMTSSPNGSWTDPYSHSAFTKRQKRYNMNIRHKSSIYTPQVIVGGGAETVGGKKEKINALIAAAPRTGATVSSSLSQGGMLFEIGESENGGNAYLVTFKARTSTRITSGANAGKIFEEVNVVTGIRPLGVVRKRGGEIWVEKPGDTEHCALIIQEPGQNRVIAAAYCPG
ncbi:DUF1223 domain-containing protein [Hyphococcus sp.]|jgi:hypothetical protein|uniref:DUF1223 domain-containing protein n=1 Tax=Hyphococcus sp. TaxID=2038636 RepID=UPI003D0D6268